MKSLLLLACAYIVGLTAVSAMTITFDDTKSLNNIYDGFKWAGFNVLDGTSASNSGFHNGVVSPINVAVDIDGRAASFGGALFNLNSAYLTGAYNDGLNVEVQGFNGTKLLYDHTYVVNATGPTLLDFNYAGITEANFIPSGGTPHPGYGSHGVHSTDFVMDNVTISTPDGGVTAGLLGMTFVGLVMLRKKFAEAENFKKA